MSYAEIASHGPPQTAEERAAPPVPEVEHRTVPEATELIDVDVPHIHAVPNDFPQQPVLTETQQARLDREAEAALAANKHKHSRSARASQTAKATFSDPVVVVNALSTFTIAAVFGFGAYRQSQKPGGFGGWPGILGWVAGAGVAGAANYFGVKLFADKYRAHH